MCFGMNKLFVSLIKCLFDNHFNDCGVNTNKDDKLIIMLCLNFIIIQQNVFFFYFIIRYIQKYLG